MKRVRLLMKEVNVMKESQLLQASKKIVLTGGA